MVRDASTDGTVMNETAHERAMKEALEFAEQWPGLDIVLPRRLLATGELDEKQRSDWLARSKRLPYTFDQWETYEQFEEVLAPGPLWRSKTLEQRRLAAQVEFCLEHMKPKDSELLQLRFNEGLTLEEIGKQLGISYQAVQSRLKTAYQNMKAKMAELGNSILEVDDEEL